MKVSTTEEILAKFAKKTIIGGLKLISGAETLTLDSTNGTEMISKRNDIFNCHIDQDFEGYIYNSESQPTDAINVQVCEMVEDGHFKNIYEGLGGDLDMLCLTQGQIISFVQKYRNWLRTEGYGTFFLFKEDKQFFVALVIFDLKMLSVYSLDFSANLVFGAEECRRFVIPQPTLRN